MCNRCAIVPRYYFAGNKGKGRGFAAQGYPNTCEKSPIPARVDFRSADSGSQFDSDLRFIRAEWQHEWLNYHLCKIPKNTSKLPRPMITPGRIPVIVSAIREAIHGSQHDYTKGSIGRSVLLLSVPMVLEMLMESVFVVVDVFFVAKLGASAVATVGLTESLVTIIFTLAIGLSIGVTAMVARRIGEHNPDGAARAAVQAIIVGLILSLIISVIGVMYAPSLLGLMNASDEVLRIGSGYTRMMLGGNASIVLIFLLNAIFRGAGDAAIAMRVLWLANFINILLGPCLIFGLGPFPELGVVGAAIATTIGRSTGAALCIVATCPGWRSRTNTAQTSFARSCADDEVDTAFGVGCIPGVYWNGKLDRIDQDNFNVWRRCCRRLYNRNADHYFRAAAIMGNEQCRRDNGWTSPRRRQTRSRRECSMEGRLL